MFTGFVMGDVDFGGNTLAGSDTNRDLFVTKLKRDSLEHDWSYRWGDEKEQRGESVEVDSTTGDVVITGTLIGRATFEGGPVGTHDNDSDAFILRLNSAGDVMYGPAFGETGRTQRGTAVLPRDGGFALLGGIFEGDLTCAGEPFYNDAGTDMFLTQIDPDGGRMWCQSMSGSGSVELADMAALGPASIVIFGTFDGTMNIGGTSLTAHGSTRDLFLAKLDLQ